MQTIFVATDRNGKVYTYTDKPVWQDSSGTFAGHWGFVDCAPSFAPPPGECRECRLAPAGEADAKDARISEMEQQLSERDNQLTLARGDVEVYRKQLASRSPGVMPECVKRLADLSRNNEVTMGELEAAVESVEAHFSPRDGHEWKTVDDANHITAEDVGREVCCLGRIIGSRGSVESCVKISQTHILRPIAPKFVFAGELGWYEFTSTFGTGRMEVVRRSDGSLAGLHEVGRVDISPDGTFAGGRITRRAE